MKTFESFQRHRPFLCQAQAEELVSMSLRCADLPRICKTVPGKRKDEHSCKIGMSCCWKKDRALSMRMATL
ncbi:hypothetical protein ACM43_19120 [Bradyrhizobium sp. CCBAU 45321]|nr:hypothetical protein [Bradyrhizobium sp. CCBAU 45321]